MKNYYRIMLGRKSSHAEEAYKGSYIAAGFIPDSDLTHHLLDNWRDFNNEYIPIFLQQNPDKTKISAGLACGMLWTVARGVQKGDVVLCPDGKGSYYAGEVIGDYKYQKGENLPHRRAVRWFSKTISRDEMSESLKHSAGSIGTVSNISEYAAEIETLLSGSRPQMIVATDETIENPSQFALEEHLEDFLVENWESTDLGKRYDIYEEDGEMVGQQYPSDTGPIDILAISKDKKELLIVELKKGRTSDIVVGQVQRYMGYVKEELAEEGQSVRGAIIAFEDDKKINRALSVAPNIDFYTYKIQFKLEKK
ncbi:MAG: endonuclease NucS [Candidatus Margulisbacteria bacterium]|nr:endonuclease NucS [Candidatus Margulisiibacteriota bacterium]